MNKSSMQGHIEVAYANDWFVALLVIGVIVAFIALVLGVTSVVCWMLDNKRYAILGRMVDDLDYMEPINPNGPRVPSLTDLRKRRP